MPSTPRRPTPLTYAAILLAGALALLGGSMPVHAQDQATFRDAMLGVALGSAPCPQRVPKYLQIAQQAIAARQPWWAASVYASAAACLAQAGQVAEAMKALLEAEKLGLDDCWLLRNDPMLKGLHGNSGFRALVQRTRMSRADFDEVIWLVKEMRHILHDTNMMITENVNRPDDAWTMVPMSRVPTRQTRSMTVGLMRLFVGGLQIYQRSMVSRSDQSRLSHNTNLRVINRGQGPNQMVVADSSRRARQRAEQRQLAMRARAYKPSGLPGVPVSCSSL